MLVRRTPFRLPLGRRSLSLGPEVRKLHNSFYVLDVGLSLNQRCRCVAGDPVRNFAATRRFDLSAPFPRASNYSCGCTEDLFDKWSTTHTPVFTPPSARKITPIYAPFWVFDTNVVKTTYLPHSQQTSSSSLHMQVCVASENVRKCAILCVPAQVYAGHQHPRAWVHRTLRLPSWERLDTQSLHSALTGTNPGHAEEEQGSVAVERRGAL